MSDLTVLNIICFQTQKKLTTLHRIGVLLKGILTEFHVRNFMLAKISLRACCAHARHRAPILSSPAKVKSKRRYEMKLNEKQDNIRGRSLVVSDLHSDTKGSRLEPGC